MFFHPFFLSLLVFQRLYFNRTFCYCTVLTSLLYAIQLSLLLKGTVVAPPDKFGNFFIFLSLDMNLVCF